MLKILLAMVALSHGPALARQLPSMNHMARDGVIDPLQSIHIVEWSCSASTRPSRAVLNIRDIGAPTRNLKFSITLGHVLVEGKRINASTRLAIANRLLSLNNLEMFKGQCRNKLPTLYIRGFSLIGGRYQKEEFEIDLVR